LKHFTVPSFWHNYNKLPKEIQQLADKNYQLLNENPFHPSLHLKKIKNYWSVRIGLRYRALGLENGNNVIWFWIGDHEGYDKLL
jgi:mRNA-degrading endonuclease RelE of RelBE toxin-antitoxin system